MAFPQLYQQGLGWEGMFYQNRVLSEGLSVSCLKFSSTVSVHVLTEFEDLSPEGGPGQINMNCEC